MKINKTMTSRKGILGKIIKASVGFLSFILFAQASYAIGVTPVRTELDLAPGESSEVTLTIISETEKDINVIPDVEAFLRNDEQGFPIPIELAESDVHNIVNWIKIPTEPVLLPAGESVDVTFSVEVPSEAEPGGKYVLIAYKPLEKPEGEVVVITRVASLVLINVKGDVVIEGDVESFELPNVIESDKPFVFPVKFSNTGNTHVKPQGWVEIADQKTGEVLKGVAVYTDPETGVTVTSDKIPVNLHGGNVLPNSKRIFNAEWNNNVKAGSYKALLALEYGEDVQTSREMEFKLDEDLRAESFAINIGEAEADFTLTLKNNGNVYEKLAGMIEISNEFGYTVAEVIIPEEIEYVAPGEIKSFTFDWLNKDIPKGRYTAKVKAKHGVTNSDFTAKVSFGEIDYTKYLLGVAVIIIVILFVALVMKKRRN